MRAGGENISPMGESKRAHKKICRDRGIKWTYSLEANIFLHIRLRFDQSYQAARGRGILVVAVTQCLRGGVALDTYAVGAGLKENDVISGGDMTTEAVVAKLAYLFGCTANQKVREACLTMWVEGDTRSVYEFPP